MAIFWLGVHHPNWLAKTTAPLFISRRRLVKYRRLPVALGAWCLDSGGFSELSIHGRWTISAEQYVAEVRRFATEIGGLEWAAIQDHMCEPFITAKTGRTVAEHQQLTCDNYAELLDRAPDLPWTPVIQGWLPADYLRHVDEYRRRGLPLDRVVGVGSVCRRQAITQAGEILQSLVSVGLSRLHGFGFKTLGLKRFQHLLHSADSMAWSFEARRRQVALPGCAGHKNCANCLRYALEWRENLLGRLTQEAA